MGIPRNKEADREAEKPSISGDNVFEKVLHLNVNRLVMAYILVKCQESWPSLLVNNLKFKSIRESIQPWSSLFL